VSRNEEGGRNTGPFEEIINRLDVLRAQLARIEMRLAIQGDITMSAIDDLKAAVAKDRDLRSAIIAALKGQAALVAAAGTDAATLQALTADLAAGAADMAAAIVANTPAATLAPAAPASTSAA
jgi:hypothetical protein